MRELEATFKEFIQKGEAIFAKYLRDTEALSAKTKELEGQREKLANQEQITLSLEVNLREKLRQAEESRLNYESKLDEALKLKSKAESLRTSLDERQEAMNREREAFYQDQQELANREKWLEVEARRLKSFDHKLRILAEDKEIKSQLESLGELK